MKFPLVLLGFMASGKSALGKKMAHQLNVPFTDTDQMIEEREKMGIGKIFKQKGENYFRSLEKELIQNLDYSKKQVIAIGGGTACYPEILMFLKDRASLIYLQLPKEILIGRLRSEKHKRPLTAELSDEEIKQMVVQKMREREPFYLQADFIVKNPNATAKKILAEIGLSVERE